EQGGDPEAGDGFVAEFPDRIARPAGALAGPFDAGGRGGPRLRLPAVDEPFDDALAQVGFQRLPLRGAPDLGHRGDARLDEVLDLLEGDLGADDFARERLFEVRRVLDE